MNGLALFLFGAALIVAAYLMARIGMAKDESMDQVVRNMPQGKKNAMLFSAISGAAFAVAGALLAAVTP